MKNYHRVIPRDFFNEAKLLKCLGAFQLAILDNQTNGIKFDVDYDGSPFEIFQNPNDGSIEVINYKVYFNTEEVQLYTPLNSKDNYPLIARYKNEEYYPIDEKGKFVLDWIRNGQV